MIRFSAHLIPLPELSELICTPNIIYNKSASDVGRALLFVIFQCLFLGVGLLKSTLIIYLVVFACCG